MKLSGHWQRDTPQKQTPAAARKRCRILNPPGKETPRTFSRNETLSIAWSTSNPKTLPAIATAINPL